MSTSKEYVTKLHKEHQEWLSAFDFYKQEIGIFKNRLTEVASKNTNKELKMMVSHFENQFYINNNIIDEIKHLINERETEFTKMMKENAVAFEHKTVGDSAELRGKKIMFDKLYSELKNDFHTFLSKSM